MIELEQTSGGIGGAHWLVKFNGKYMGHFYPDYDDYADYENFLEYLTTGDKPKSERK